MIKGRVIPLLAGAALVWAATAYHYINTSEAITWIIFALFFVWTVYKKEVFPRLQIPSGILVAMATFYGGLLFSTLFHLDNLENLSGGYYSVLVFLRYTAVFWMLLYIGWTRDIRKAVFWTLLAITYAICLTSLYQIFVLNIPPHSLYRTQHVTTMMIDMLLPMMAGLGYYYRSQSLYKWLCWCTIPIQLVVIFLAKVRGADLALIGAMVVCGAVWFYLSRDKLPLKKFFIMLTGVILVVGLAIGHSINFSDAGAVHVRGGGDRMYMWSAGYEIWKDHPLTGVGLNEWMTTYESPEYYPEGAREKGFDHPHNVFVYFFATSGLLGGGAYIFYCLGMAGYFINCLKKNRQNALAWGMLFAFTAMTVHGVVDCNFIFKLVGRTFYMLLGAALLFEHWQEKDLLGKEREMV